MMTAVRLKRRLFLPLVFTSHYFKKPLLKSVKRQIGCAVEYSALNLAMLENFLSEKKKALGCLCVSILNNFRII